MKEVRERRRDRRRGEERSTKLKGKDDVCIKLRYVLHSSDRVYERKRIAIKDRVQDAG